MAGVSGGTKVVLLARGNGQWCLIGSGQGWGQTASLGMGRACPLAMHKGGHGHLGSSLVMTKTSEHDHGHSGGLAWVIATCANHSPPLSLGSTSPSQFSLSLVKQTSIQGGLLEGGT